MDGAFCMPVFQPSEGTPMPDFSGDDEATYNNLRSHTPAREGAAPTPANFPRRRPTPRTAVEVEQVEGLDLNLAQFLASRASRARRHTSRPQSTQQSLPVWIFHRVRESPVGYGRDTAWPLAQEWARMVTGREHFTEWAWAVGLSRPKAAAELMDHGFTPDVLDTLIEGKPARSLLRTGYDVQEVIYGLYQAARNEATC